MESIFTPTFKEIIETKKYPKANQLNNILNFIALVALALMTAKSLPQQKATVVALIVNMLMDGE